MSPQRFLSLSASIDRHRVDPRRIDAPTLIHRSDSDHLVFADAPQRLARGAMRELSELHLLNSLYGHDMFLKETTRIGEIVAPFLTIA